MAKQTKEVAVIEFEKFSIEQLPELQGKIEEIKGIIEANPTVDVIDNSTYELAKKSRTAVKTLRTSLEKEQKDVKKRIKEFVVDVVDNEYSGLIDGVRISESERQNPIDIWEAKKEEERLEKVRLEDLRIQNIKDSISEFKSNQQEFINSCIFVSIDATKKVFEKSCDEFDRVSLQEFEVLFDDAVNYLTNLLNSKISTLTEQEQIRVDNLLIEEKQAESKTIQSWQSEWRTNIDSLKFDDVKDVKSILVKLKLVGLKHYSTEYDEIFTSTEKRLHSQIELVSKAEEQRIAQEKFNKEQVEIAKKNRIAQEKFLAEKKEFEEKQAELQKKSEYELKTDARIEQLIGYGLKFDFQSTFTDGNFFIDILDIKTYDDKKWDSLISDIIRVQKDISDKEIIETIISPETDEIAQENWHESNVDPKGIAKEESREEKILTENPDLINWQNIDAIWRKHYTQTHSLIEYLEEFYNPPTKKQ